MRAVSVLAVALAVGLCGCGYADDNRRAAALVAQVYLDSFAEREPTAICRVLAPEVQGAIASGHPSCEAGLAERLSRPHPRRTTGRVRRIAPPSPDNPRYAVEVRGEPGRWIIVGRYGSTWRVVDGGTPQ